MVCQEIKDFLAVHADARYAAFVTSLMPGTRPVVGVRLPVLRALAKEIAKGGLAYLFGGGSGRHVRRSHVAGLRDGRGADAV